MDSLLERGARQGLENMLGFKPGEKACIVTDRATMAETENAFVEVARKISGEENVKVYVLEDYGDRPLREVPGDLTADAKKADVTMFVAEAIGDELSTVRIPLIRTATQNGAAHGHCPGFKRQMMAEGMAADYHVVYALSKALAQMLTPARRINVTSPIGTNLVVGVNPAQFPWLYSKPVARGEMANLPDGETFCFPANVYGTAVVDGCVGDSMGKKYGNLDKTPLTVNIAANMVYNAVCEGSPELAKEFLNYVHNGDGKKEFLTRRVGEFALGTNIFIESILGEMLQDEKKGDAMHFALGNPLSDEGSGAGYECKGHLDCLIIKPTIRVNGRVIMDAGQYTEEVMRATLQHLPVGYHLARDLKSFVTPQ